MKKIFSVFTLVFVLVFFCGNVNVHAKSKAGELNIVVLGDSIARGYGLENVEKQRFSTVLEEKLFSDYSKVTVSNFGVDGIMGKDLLESLNESPPKELETCDYVLISIGGNNVLRGLSDLEGLGELAYGIEPKVFIDYFKYLFSKDETEREALDYARETLNMLFKAANDAFESESFKSLAETASNDLKSEIPEIISKIKSINPNAKIVIQTVYNPYNGLHIRLKGLDEGLDLSYFGEYAVSHLNEVIESLAEENGYKVAPVYEGFESSSERLTNAGFELLNKVFGVDPHPNEKGHELIAEIYYKIIREEQNV